MAFRSDRVQFVLRGGVACLLVLGILLRVSHLDRQLYWGDEVYTSLRISGYTVAEIEQELGGRAIAVAEMRKYQSPGPWKTSSDTVRGLALEEAQHVPLYFVLARAWAQCFGDSVAVIRGLSALFSLLAFPCLYWLSRELFESSRVAWFAMILMAVSPVHLV